ncbi:hypothetical protein CB0940_09203 [Cercospora beticola]|uniref:Uncharacterized protein n=1 Tax=Cercospora beticola TaxID=122368 RepID=A0A2G5HGS2_CERBT|nr:hypothetical protein CB0940_09203 [Cercospora beticola]PIA91744.1 hypothetical protein CB0940_09203 [Cercospora beticola]WPB06501.1 hypothetical protein RHO25_011158 [Cercospora beticola]CAK1366408.1 unnamed protein product [Cercospora beticola]
MQIHIFSVIFVIAATTSAELVANTNFNCGQPYHGQLRRQAIKYPCTGTNACDDLFCKSQCNSGTATRWYGILTKGVCQCYCSG